MKRSIKFSGKFLGAFLIFILSVNGFAKTELSKNNGKQENFDSQLVEGQVYRPDLSVVTGDAANDSFGVLRLRKDFNDHVKSDEGKEIK